MAGTQPTKTLVSETVTVEPDGLTVKDTVEFDHMSGIETKSRFVQEPGGNWAVTDRTDTITAPAWDISTWSREAWGNTFSPWQSSSITTTTPANITISPSGEDVPDLMDLVPLLELVGHCVACGDDAELVLCPPCGLAVRELGRQRLAEYLEEIQEELS